MVFGVSWRFAFQLPEMADIVQADGGVAQSFVAGIHGLRPGEVKHRPEQHRRMTVREHKPVAVRPDGMLRIEPHHAIPDRIDERRQCHGGAGVSGFGLLNSVYGESADGIDAQLVERRGVCLWFGQVRDAHWISAACF
jgi:hypothetical protein